MTAPTPDQMAEWRRLATEGYQPRGNRAVWAQRCAVLIDAVAEYQENELDMARKAHIAEIHAEEAEYHVEQLRDALDSAERIEARAVELATERDAALARIARAERLIDSWERDAPDHSNPVFIGRLRECLRRDAAPIQLRSEQCDCAGRLVETNAHEDTCPVNQERWSDPEYVAAWEEAHPCDHEWLDRPESDTRECLICGTEVAG